MRADRNGSSNDRVHKRANVPSLFVFFPDRGHTHTLMGRLVRWADPERYEEIPEE